MNSESSIIREIKAVDYLEHLLLILFQDLNEGVSRVFEIVLKMNLYRCHLIINEEGLKTLFVCLIPSDLQLMFVTQILSLVVLGFERFGED